MKHYRISIDVDIKATDRPQAELRAGAMYGYLAQLPHVVEVLPNGIEERIPLTQEGSMK
jgi:hypothetical protein